jgi:hypothetical protein
MSFRLFAMPVLILLLGQVSGIFLFVWSSHVEAFVLLDLAITAKLISLMLWLGSLAIGLSWLLMRLKTLFLWKKRRLYGGCVHCQGALSHHDDEHGFYSKCMMCNARHY